MEKPFYSFLLLLWFWKTRCQWFYLPWFTSWGSVRGWPSSPSNKNYNCFVKQQKFAATCASYNTSCSSTLQRSWWQLDLTTLEDFCILFLLKYLKLNLCLSSSLQRPAAAGFRSMWPIWAEGKSHLSSLVYHSFIRKDQLTLTQHLAAVKRLILWVAAYAVNLAWGQRLPSVSGCRETDWLIDWDSQKQL